MLGFSFCGNHKANNQEHVRDMLIFNQDDYAKEWREIQTLEKKGLPKSALEKVIALYERAVDDNNPAQVIKCIIYREKYSSQLEEDGLTKAMEGVRQDLQKASFPVSAILESMLGEMYNNYQVNNAYLLKDRTKIAGELPNDLKTWTIEDFINESNKHFRNSIKDERLKSIKLDGFKEIMTEEKGTSKLRTSIYDFLVHRAIDNFINAGSYLNEPAYKFYVNQDEAFADAQSFVNYKFEAKQADSEKYQSILLFQELLSYRLKENNALALLDADLKRLSFINTVGIHPNKEDLYLSRLKKLLLSNADNEGFAEVSYQLAAHYQAQGHKVGGKEANAWAKAYDYCTAAIDKYPQSYGANRCQNLLHQLEQEQLGIIIEDVNLPNENLLTKINYRNTKQAYIKVVKLPQLFYDKKRPRGNKKELELLNDQTALFSELVSLPSPRDFKSHSIEFKIPDLPFGEYAILCSNKEGFNFNNAITSYTRFWVSNISYVEKKDKLNKHSLLVVHRNLGSPLEKVKVDFYKSVYDADSRRNKDVLVKTDYTDKNGFVDVPNSARQESIRPTFTLGDDVLRREAYLYNRYREPQTNVKQFVHFFLDRGIYRPGQKLYFKGLVYNNNPDGIPEIVPNEEITVTFKDANYQKVDDLILRTNEYGSISGHFIIPSSGLLGKMRIQSGGSSKQFSVEEYKRPKFEVNFDKVVGEFNLEDEITIKGKAIAFAGYPIDKANVTYRVERTYRFPFWRYYWSYRQDPPMVIKNGIAETDENGAFEINFDLTPDPTVDKDQKPIFRYIVYADVLDNTGETRSSSTTIQAAYIGLEVSLDIPESINLDSINEVVINSQNLNGNEEFIDASIEIEALKDLDKEYRKRYWPEPDTSIYTKAEFKAHFRSYAFKGEDKIENLAVKSKAKSFKLNTKEQKSFDLGEALKAGKYKLTLNTKDKKGNDIELIKYFTAFGSKQKSIPFAANILHHRSNRSYEPGETCEFFLNSSLDPLYVFYEVEKKNKAIERRWLKIDQLENFDIPVVEDDRGNFYYQLSYVHNNRTFSLLQKVHVPWSNKELKISYGTFRDKLLPGQEEEWKIKISGPKKDKVAAEFLAGMYDASLDEFVKNDWTSSFYPEFHSRVGNSSFQHFNTSRSRRLSEYKRRKHVNVYRQYHRLNWFGFQWWGNWMGGMSGEVVMEDAVSMSAPPRAGKRSEKRMVAKEQSLALDEDMEMAPTDTIAEGAAEFNATPIEENKKPNSVRTNLDETVFFFPDLETDEEGNVIVKFKMNEALTKWKFLGFAHTKDFKFALTTKEVQTQKELMVQPNAPRFFREGDKISYTAKVVNLTEKPLQGKAKLSLFDAISMEEVDLDFANENAKIDFNLEGGASQGLSWSLEIPFSKASALVHRVTVEAGAYSDGEESALPVLTNRMLVTETMPLPIRAGQNKTFVFEEMKENKSSTLSHHKYSLEFTSNPAWYAVQALPYMMEYPYKCTEQVFTRMYANALATHVANDNPKIKRIFESWKGTDAMKSNLSKNEELKTALLEETPWVLDAQSEEQQKKNIGLLFDLNRMSNELDKDLALLKDRQLSNGGFSWFPGGKDSWYITQYLVEGFGHLQELGVLNLSEGTTSINSAKAAEDQMQILRSSIIYLDNRVVEYYDKVSSTGRNNLSNLMIHYLYARSFFKEIPHQGRSQKVFNHYYKLAEDKCLQRSLYEQGMLALVFDRFESKAKADLIVASLKERALMHNELGMYWKYNKGFYWYQMPIETHALMIEVFEKVAKDRAAVDELRLWLLKNKQTNNWKTTKATSSAVYALLLSGDDWLNENKPVEVIFPNKALNQDLAHAQAKAEAGTGYFKKSWDTYNPQLSTIKVVNNNSVAAWGAAYWQYFEDLDKIKTFEKTPLQLKKAIFKEVKTDSNDQLEKVEANSKLSAGEKLIIRIELRVDRDMEYVHMKDMRASGFEPLNVISTYKWQGGLGYYESTRDASTNFFFDFLPKGTYVFEYPLRVVHEGDFSNGITTIQCMYAPEFTSHSEGERILVKSN